MTRIAIIGAGVSGLAAARHLTDNSDYEVHVLEANPDRYGGRIWSHEPPGFTGHPVEFGAMWLHGGTCHAHPLTKVCLKFGIPLIHHDEGRSDMILTYNLQGEKYTTDDFETVQRACQHMVNLQNEFVEQKCNDTTYESAIETLAHRFPELMNQNSVRLFGIPELESFEGASKREVNDTLSLIFSKGIPDSNEAIKLEGEDLLIPTGYKTLLEKLINEGRKFQMSLDRKVTHVSIDDDKKVTISGINARNENFTLFVDHVIATVSLGILKSNAINFEPPLSNEMKKAVRNLGFGDKIKILLVYDKIFWPNVEVFGTEEEIPGYPLFFVNLHKIHGLPGLLATVGGSGVHPAENETDDAILTRTIKRIRVMFGNEVVSQSKLVFHKIVRWKHQANIEGAYSFAKIGMNKDDAYNIRKPIGESIFFAGEHTTFPECVYGTVHGAYLSGIRAADEILHLKRCRNDLLGEQQQTTVATKVVKFLPK